MGMDDHEGVLSLCSIVTMHNFFFNKIYEVENQAGGCRSCSKLVSK
jgi:hypothetical protein